MSSQIVNWKIVEGVLGLKKCYQCGGETLVPVVKHPLCDSGTVELVLTHTPWWTTGAMGYGGLWG